ncbi:MAG: thioredoxin [Dehalococcoidia bacterium]|nr:MAG: thioredoxin [Dehalococcoidia bacterium]
MVLEVNEQTFEDEVTKAELPTVVDYWAPWCGPCMILGPMVEKLSEAYKDKVKFCKVNVDENMQLASNARVQSIPLLVFYKNGERVDESIGVVPETELRSKIDAML